MKKKFIIAVDLGGTNLKIALFDPACRIKDRENFDTQRFLTKRSLIRAIARSIGNFIESHALDASSIAGVGFGLPGPIDADRGLVHFFPNIPGWSNVNLKKILKRELRLAVFLDNDANLMALAEHRLGKAKGFDNAVCVTLGTGVGAGIIIGGKLYRGSSYAAGEVGHIPVNEAGPRCTCGGVACLEAYIGNNRILQAARGAFGKRISLEELSALAGKGDARAKKIWEQVGSRLGIALSGIVNVLNPDVIVIGGGVAKAGRILFDTVRETIGRRAMSVQSKRVKIHPAALGSDAGLIGAAVLVRESLSVKKKSRK